MFVGSTGDPGIFQLALEVIGNAIDLVLRGDATSIEVSRFEDGSVEMRLREPESRIELPTYSSLRRTLQRSSRRSFFEASSLVH